MNTIILHGTLGSPEGNWFRWLEQELKNQGHIVWLPTLPNAAQPNLQEWATYVHQNAPFELNQDTIIISHSSGAILALILAQQQPADKPLKATVAVSVFHDNSLNWEPNNRLFDNITFDWQKIHDNTQKLLFVHSDNDPYVPLDQATYVADNCQAKMIVIPNQGHFNLEQSADYKQFPRLMVLFKQHGIL